MVATIQLAKPAVWNTRYAVLRIRRADERSVRPGPFARSCLIRPARTHRDAGVVDHDAVPLPPTLSSVRRLTDG
jgi:hypothetical protein